MSDKSFGLRTSKGFIAKIVLAVVGFIGSVYFARALGPAGYGTYGTIVAAAGVLDNPITGIGDACKKRISEPEIRGEEILSVGLFMAIFGGLILSMVGFGIERTIGYFGVESGGMLLALTLVGIATFKITQQVLSGTGRFGDAIVFDMIRSVVTIPLQIVFVVIGLGVSGMVFGLTAASLLLVPVMIISMRTWPATPSSNTIKSLWKYARFSIPNGFVSATYSRLDILLLNGILGAAVAGEYKIAYQLVLPGTMLSGVMSSGLFAEVSAKSSRDRTIDSRVAHNIAFASLVAIPLAFGAAAMPTDLLVTVFGSDYEDAAVLLVGLGIYQIIFTQTSQVQSVVTGSDRPDLGFVVDTITVSFNVIVGILLLFELGGIGVVIATIIAELLRYSSYAFIAHRFATFPTIPMPLVHQVLAGAIMFVVVDLIHGWFGVGSWIDLIGLITLGGIVYIGLLLYLSEPVLTAIKTIIVDVRRQYQI